MTTLFIVEHDNSQCADSTRRVLGAARALGAPVHALVAGEGCRAVAEQVAQIEGIAKVLIVDEAALRDALAEPLADLAAALVTAKGYMNVIAAASSAGKNLMPRLAGLLDVMIVPDVVAIEASDVFVRPIYAGNALERLRSHDAVKVITARASAFAETSAGAGTTAAIETIPGVTPGVTRSRLVRREFVKSERPALSAAKIVIAGGRALASAENFETVLTPLADALGAALGASRAAVDAGYAPNDWQVGQTGKIVAPDLYIAVGISGAIQHMAGMKDSKTIIAINTDAEAPIFQIADYGLVADALTAVPGLVAKLRASA